MNYDGVWNLTIFDDKVIPVLHPLCIPISFSSL
jgi:hypothetical protein